MANGSRLSLATAGAVLLVAGCTAGVSSTGAAGPRTYPQTAGSDRRPAATAGSSATASPPPIIRAYEFPGGMIDGGAGGGKLYTRVEALVAIPQTPGRHPVAVVVHGSYPSCIDATKDQLITSAALTTPWPEGCGAQRSINDQAITAGPDYLRTPASMAYLARALADKGFAVVIPDVNTKERLDWGGEPNPRVLQTALVKLHLGLLARLDKGETLTLPWAGELKDKLDLSTIVTVGHSSGGGYVVDAAQTGALPQVKAIVALEPSFNEAVKKVNPLPPTLIVAGECDEQIPLATTQQEIGALGRAHPGSVVLGATLAHATHIGTLHGGGSNAIGMVNPPTNPTCRPAALLAKPTQRAELARLTADFLSQALRGGSAYTLTALSGTSVTASAATKVATVTVAPSSDAPAQVDPKSVVYTRSAVPVLPAKPATLKLYDGSKREV